MFRHRPIRSQLYLPIVKFGVPDTDWPYLLFVPLGTYIVFFFSGLEIARVPLELPATVFAFVGAVAFSNLIRRGRRPFWLQHTLAAAVTPARRRRRLPSDAAARPPRPWVL